MRRPVRPGPRQSTLRLLAAAACLLGAARAFEEGRRDGVAICVGGRADVAVPDLGSAMNEGQQWEATRVLEKFLAEPLGAELYFFLSYRAHKGVSSDMRQYMLTAWRIRAKVMDTLGLRHLESVRELLERGHAENQTWLPLMFETGKKPYKFYLILQQWLQCLDAIRTVERDEGFLYRYVLFTRLDLIWLAQHPPLSAIEPTRCGGGRSTVWVLDGEEYAGVNDRYILAERKAADVISDLWRQLRNFTAANEVQRFLQGRGVWARPWRGTGKGTERHVLHAMFFAGHCVRRITSVASVVHSDETTARPDYVWERLAALGFARIKHCGGTWEPAPEEPYLHGAACAQLYPKGGPLRHCCSAAALDYGGHDSCWHDFTPRMYSLQRCCQRHHVHVTLRPSERTVRGWLEVQAEHPNISWHEGLELGRKTRVSSRAQPLKGEGGKHTLWHCVPFGPRQAEGLTTWSDFKDEADGRMQELHGSDSMWVAWGSSSYDTMPIGSVQCYDVDRLAAGLAGQPT